MGPVDLAVMLAGVRFRNPFIVGSGPTVTRLEHIRKAADAGWAGASIKLAVQPTPYINLPPRYRWLKRQQLHIFTAETRLTVAESLKLLEQGRQVADDFVVIPTITYDGEDDNGWVDLAQKFERAGARIIELNMCCPNMSFNLNVTGQNTRKATGASLGSDLVRLPEVVGRIAGSISSPVIVKLTPEGGRIAAVAVMALKAGAAAIGSVANRLGIPDIDIRHPMGTIYRLQDNITLGCLSGPWIRPLALRDTYEIRMAVGQEPFIIGSGGVNDLSSAVQQIMVGADAVWICTETMLRGFDWLPKTLDALRSYMQDMGYSKIRDFRDMLCGNIKSANQLAVYDGYAVVDNTKCNSCGLCSQIGHCTAIHASTKGVTVAPRSCSGCSTCVDVCPRGAIGMARA